VRLHPHAWLQRRLQILIRAADYVFMSNPRRLRAFLRWRGAVLLRLRGIRLARVSARRV
jgi:hypothetical protein